jgi:hypothetical protein
VAAQHCRLGTLAALRGIPLPGVAAGADIRLAVDIRSESNGAGHGLSGASYGHTGTEGASESGAGVHGLGSSGPGARAESNTGPGLVASAAGAESQYEPGDVPVIGADGKLAVAHEPRATAVAGAYSAHPGFVGDASAARSPLAAAG